MSDMLPGQIQGIETLSAIDERLAELGFELPVAGPPMAALLTPYRLIGDRLLVSAQTPKRNGELTYIGKVGDVHDLEAAQKATELCALNVLAQARAALDGELGRVAAVAQLRGYVNVTPDFHMIAEAVNGASKLMLDVFGADIGAHCRTAVGAASMPFDATAEVEAEFVVIQTI
jgi:enamine deaminase RidA (YjgF/YER057c/UK114 family)